MHVLRRSVQRQLVFSPPTPGGKTSYYEHLTTMTSGYAGFEAPGDDKHDERFSHRSSLGSVNLVGLPLPSDVSKFGSQ